MDIHFIFLDGRIQLYDRKFCTPGLVGYESLMTSDTS